MARTPKSSSGGESRSWLPRRQAPQPPPDLTPWRPLGVPDGLVHLHYAVIEEWVSTTIVLLVSPWPDVDSKGRLWFSSVEERSEVAADQKQLTTFLDRHRQVGGKLSREARQALAVRDLVLGDVFAVRVNRTGLARAAESEEIVKPSSWIKPPVYDVTADARQAAREAFYVALTPPLSKEAHQEVVVEQLRPKETQ